MPSEIPQGWEVRSLAATAALCTTGYWGEDEDGPDLLPARVIRNGDVGEGRIKAALPTRFFTAKQIERARVAPGDAILVSSGNVGRIARVGESDANPVTVASNFVRLVRAGPLATGEFLGHLLASSLVQQQLATHIAGSAIKNLHASAYDEVLLPLPPLSEQRKIAAILSSVDETIEKTEAVIAQLDVAKKAMLEELLTRGIPGRHSRFKQTEIGEVPESWSVVPTGDALEKLPVGQRYDARTRMESGAVPILDQSAEGVFGYHSDAPDILANPDAPVVTFANHTCAVRFLNSPFSVIQNVFPLRGKNGVGTRFLYYILQTRLTSNGYKGHWPDMMETFSPAPPAEEQAGITAALDAIGDRLAAEVGACRRLQHVKDVLGFALLSGELRVDVGAA